jgi:hypothetical protein
MAVSDSDKDSEMEERKSGSSDSFVADYLACGMPFIVSWKEGDEIKCRCRCLCGFLCDKVDTFCR